MERITQEELDRILLDHELWTKDPSMGGRADFDGKTLSYLKFKYKNLQTINFERADLSYADLSSCKFNYCRFDNAIMSHANLKECTFYGSSLSGANLSYSNLNCVSLSTTSLKGARVDNASMEYINVSYGAFDDSILIEGIGELNRRAIYFYKKDRVIFRDFDGSLSEFKDFMEKRYYEGRKEKEKEEFAICIEMFEKYRVMAKNKK